MGIKIKEWNSISEFKKTIKILMSKIKVIIPAYNEEKLLHTLLRKFQFS
jgi:cellulose synthase/poly-beta-1,6-N-acetylglucosamine synthase-like glycosyltransferase